MNQQIKDEIYKCSKCGLCKSVCPIFQATKNEMYLPRGRYIVLNNYINNNIPLSSNFIKDTDICLNCNLCKLFCPSSIDSEKINTLIKNENNYKFGILTFFQYYQIILYSNYCQYIIIKANIP